MVKSSEISYQIPNKRSPIVCRVNFLTGCHEVISNKPRNDGYIMVSTSENGKVQHHFAHRKMYQIHKGEIPFKMSVMHTCDNPACINPEHLILGSHKDNMIDKIAKGRSSASKGNFSSKRILSAKDVIWIKNNLDKYTDKEIAQMYGVVYQTIYEIRNNVNWREVSKDDNPNDIKFAKFKKHFTFEDIELIKEYSMTLPELAEKFNCSKNTLSMIRRGYLPNYLKAKMGNNDAA